jgi:spore coat protein H
VAEDTPVSDVNAYRATYLDLVSNISVGKGAKAFETLNTSLDMQSYFRWLAFNYIVRNGDYTDEVYYYIKQGSDPAQFDIIPWDYDDIFMREPHEGEETKRRILGHKLLFSSEDPLDREIAKSAYIYDRYLDELEETLNILSEDFMRRTMGQIKAELIPYLSDAAIVQAHKEDYYGGSDVEAMTDHMDKILNYLVERSEVIRKRIAIARDQ